MKKHNPKYTKISTVYAIKLYGEEKWWTEGGLAVDNPLNAWQTQHIGMASGQCTHMRCTGQGFWIVYELEVATVASLKD